MNSAERMEPASPSGLPLIGPSDQRLFDIEDTRERADRLQEVLVPKLKSLLDEACRLLTEIYGDGVLSPCRTPTTPAHRKKTKSTASFELATAGLAVKGHLWFFQQRFECTKEGLCVSLFGLRGIEGNPLIQVLQAHVEQAARLLECNGFGMGSESFEASIDDEGGVEEGEWTEIIGELRIAPERDWSGVQITGPSVDLPIEDLDAAWPALLDFATLFPIFRAATEVLQGEKDRFEDYAERFWSWANENVTWEGRENSSETGRAAETAAEGPNSGLEGGWKVAMRRHRLREKRLRKRKILEVLRRENGRLRCEVPGCGFDFLAIYGELGREFAHVHHKNPLSDRAGAEVTKLDDLAIVCANCHAMIHRGGRCRPLDGLIPSRTSV